MQKQDRQNNAKNSTGLNERLKNSDAAKKLQMEKWRLNQIDTTDPAFLEQQALRLTAAAAREARDALRKAEKEAEKAHRAATLKAIEVQAIVDQAAREAAEAESAADLAVVADQRKAARDARYAARKARQK